MCLLTSACGSAVLAITGADDDGDPELVPQATAPEPADGATDVDVLSVDSASPTAMRWTPAFNATQQTLRVARTEAGLDDDLELLVDEPVALESPSSFEIWRLGLASDTEYVWRVDSRLGTVKEFTPGAVWSFRTGVTADEIEPNDGALLATSLALGSTTFGEVGEDDVDWYRVGLLRDAAYELSMQALTFDAQSWIDSESLPEISIFDPAANSVIWRHSYTQEYFGDSRQRVYSAPLDLEFPLLAVRESGQYLVRVRATDASSASTLSTTGGRYGIALNHVERALQYELETPDDNQETGFTNEFIIEPEPVTLVESDVDPYLRELLISGYLITGRDPLTNDPFPGFDWFRFNIPQNDQIHEVRVELVGTRLGSFRPNEDGGLADIDLAFARSTNFQQAQVITADEFSFAPNDPAVSFVGQALAFVDQALFVGVVNNQAAFDSYAEGGGYTLVGSDYVLDLQLTNLTEGGVLVDELETVGGAMNDSPENAEMLDFGQVFHGNLSAQIGGGAPDGSDWISFEGQAGDVVTLQLWDARTTFGLAGSEVPSQQPSLALFDLGGGAPLLVAAYNNTTADDPCDDCNQRRVVQAILTATGTYGIQVTDALAVPSGLGADYLIRLRRDRSSDPESESNDVITEAQPFPADGCCVSGTLDGIGGDRDYFRFEANAGEVLRFTGLAAESPQGSLAVEQSSWGGVALPRIEILDAEENVLSMADSLAPAGSDVSSARRLNEPLGSVHCLFRAPAEGPFYVRVSNLGAEQGPDVRYAVELAREGD